MWKFRYAATMLAMTFLAAGCIPAEPAKAPSAPASSGDAKSGKMTLTTGNPQDGAQKDNTGIQVSSMEGGGFRVQGSFGLTGTITRESPEAKEWVFRGEFVFPRAGYQVGQLETVAISTPIPAKNGSLSMQANPDEMLIVIPLHQPAQSAISAPAETRVPVTTKIPGGPQTHFVFQLVSG
jgi:hypothetical protein